MNKSAKLGAVALFAIGWSLACGGELGDGTAADPSPEEGCIPGHMACDGIHDLLVCTKKRRWKVEQECAVEGLFCFVDRNDITRADCLAAD